MKKEVAGKHTKKVPTRTNQNQAQNGERLSLDQFNNV